MVKPEAGRKPGFPEGGLRPHKFTTQQQGGGLRSPPLFKPHPQSRIADYAHASRTRRIEELVILQAILLYAHFHFSWWLFGVLFLAPDLSMLGYLANPRVGSALYNLGHFLFFPVILFVVAYSAHRSLPLAIAIIWAAHIGFDRLLGYGLKYPAHFKNTHLQHIP